MSRITTTAVLAAVLLTLPSCIAAFGNSTSGLCGLPRSTAPILRQKVDATRRIVELREQGLQQLHKSYESGRASIDDLVDAQVAVEQARIQALQCEAELQAMLDDDDDHDDDD